MLLSLAYLSLFFYAVTAVLSVAARGVVVVLTTWDSA